MKNITINTQLSVFETLQELPQDVQDLMHQAIEIRKKAYAPYSKFRVGAALLLDNGKVVLGSNQENAAYPSGLCAERVAIFQSGAVYPEAKYEFKQDEPIEIYFMGEIGVIYKSDSLKNLLPFSFDKNFL